MATTTVVIAGGVAGGPANAASSGSADDGEYSIQATEYYTEVTARNANVEFMNEMIGACSVGTAGGTCSISSGVESTRTIELALGISRGVLAANLGVSEGISVSTQATCTSPPMAAGARWGGFAVGTQIAYRVTKISRSASTGIELGREESGPLQAQDPDPKQIYCQSVPNVSLPPS